MNATSHLDAPRRNRPSGSEITIFVIIVGIAIGIAFLGWQIASNTAKDLEYRRALPCGLGVGATAGNCVSHETMQVVGKDVDDNDNLPDTYRLNLCAPKTTPEWVDVNNALYAAVSVGDYVTAKFWRGNAMIVTAGSVRSGTSNHPEVANRQDWMFIGFFILFECFLIPLYFSEKRKRIRNSIPDVPWGTTNPTPVRFQSWSVTESRDILTMTRSHWKSPGFRLNVMFGVMLLLTFWFGYMFFYPMVRSGDWLGVALTSFFLLLGLASLWVLSKLKRVSSSREVVLEIARGGASITRNQEPLGAAKRIFLEEQTTGDEKGHQCLRVVVENGQILGLGWVYPDDMAAIRPFATHLAAFLDLPLEFTKEEKGG